MERKVTLLPEPDSPISATVLAAPEVRSTPSTAWTGFAPPMKVTVRSLHVERIGVVPHAGDPSAPA